MHIAVFAFKKFDLQIIKKSSTVWNIDFVTLIEKHLLPTLFFMDLIDQMQKKN